MRVLLDENFPLPLLAALRGAGVDADHIISLNLRGVADGRIREMLRTDRLLFLTQDLEFLSESPSTSIIVVSRVRQSRPLAERLSVWMQGIRRCSTARRSSGCSNFTTTVVLCHGDESPEASDEPRAQ